MHLAYTFGIPFVYLSCNCAQVGRRVSVPPKGTGFGILR